MDEKNDNNQVSKTKGMSISNKVSLVVISLSIVIFVITGLVISRNVTSIVKDMVNNELSLEAKNASYQVNSFLKEKSEITSGMANNATLQKYMTALKGIKESELSAPVFAGEKRVLEILADISARIPESISLQVARLVIDQKTVRLRGHTDTFNDVDKIKNALSASSRYESVQIVSATANKKSGKIRFELELEIVI